MKKVLFENPMVASTGSVLAEFTSNKATRRKIDRAEVRRRDYAWAMQCERREGKEEGIAEGIAEGKAKERAERVVKLLNRRFEKLPYQLTESLLMIDDLDKLDVLFDLAFDCETLEEFQKGMLL